MKMAISKGKEVNPKLKLGVCGEHGGDPESIRFFHEIGLSYVSASPYRISIARLAAAQAAIEKEKTTPTERETKTPKEKQKKKRKEKRKQKEKKEKEKKNKKKNRKKK